MNFCASYDEIPENLKGMLIENANIFYQKSYEENVLCRKQRLYYIWSDNNILVARVKQELFLKAAILESEPYTYHSGGESMKAFLNEAMDILKRKGVQWTICATTARFQEYPDESFVAPTGNHIIDLTCTEELLWKNVHSKHRNSIRRGEKSEIELKIGGKELLDAYVPIANETYGRSGISSSSNAYYRGLMEKLDNNIIIFLAYKEKEIQAGGMFYYNQEIAYYLHGASIRRPEPGTTNYLLWKAILYFKKMGVRNFSFVGYHFDPEPGSKLEGIQRFKERFGGILEKSYNFRFEQCPIAYRVYCFAMQIKNGKPFEKYQDAIDMQIKKYPELNGGI